MYGFNYGKIEISFTSRGMDAVDIDAASMDTTLRRASREMSYLLRHKPPPGMDASGWISVSHACFYIPRATQRDC